MVYSNNDPENAFTGSWTLEDIREDSEVVAYFGADEDEDGVPDEPSYGPSKPPPEAAAASTRRGMCSSRTAGTSALTLTPTAAMRSTVSGWTETVSVSAAPYTFEEVTENHTIRVTFTETDEGGDDDDDDDDGGITYLTITATAGEGGSISPDGRVQVAYDRNKSFIIQADEGYELADVLVDGRSVGAVGRYTFEKGIRTTPSPLSLPPARS